MNDDEIALRRPVWIALADLFLDTDVRTSYGYIARTLANSPFSSDELRRILDKEVTPALQPNLLGVAGEWAGFDDDWVVEQVLEGLKGIRILPNFVKLHRDWMSLVSLIDVMRALPTSELRLERQQAWYPLVRLFLDKPKRLMRFDQEEKASPAELAEMYHRELMPALRDGVVELSRKNADLYPTLDEVEVNWRNFNARLA